MYCAKTAEPMDMPFWDRDAVWGLIHVGPRNHVLGQGQDRTNAFAAAMGIE